MNGIPRTTRLFAVVIQMSVARDDFIKNTGAFVLESLYHSSAKR